MNRLRVALVAGTLGRGGAEKQLVYAATALLAAGADVRVFSLTRGDAHAATLAYHGLSPTWIGRFGPPPIRLAMLVAAVARFRPHVVQAGHFFTNLYVTAAARVGGAAAVGAIRSDVGYELGCHGRWGSRLLSAPPDLIANSWAAKRNAEAAGRDPSTVHVIGNVIDLAAFDAAGEAAAPRATAPTATATAMAIGSLVPVKRFDRFLGALQLARQRDDRIRGVIVGEGPERGRLEALATELGLTPDGVRFLGARDDVPALLRGADLCVLSSDHEGFPNVVLEAMSAALPIVATPCGDIERMVTDGATGYVVPPGDVGAMADRIVTLAGSGELRARLGDAGRRVVEGSYASGQLAGRLLEVYQSIAKRRRRTELAAALA